MSVPNSLIDEEKRSGDFDKSSSSTEHFGGALVSKLFFFLRCKVEPG